MRVLAPTLLLALAACITPNVLDESARSVAPPPAVFAWQPARPEDLRGLFESISIEGESAAALWKIYYHFGEDGTYSGAALIQGGAQPEFQTLSGTWKLDEGRLNLGNDQVVQAFAAPGALKLDAEGTSMIFRGVPLP